MKAILTILLISLSTVGFSQKIDGVAKPYNTSESVIKDCVYRSNDTIYCHIGNEVIIYEYKLSPLLVTNGDVQTNYYGMKKVFFARPIKSFTIKISKHENNINYPFAFL